MTNIELRGIILTLHRNNLRTLARLKALEAMISAFVPTPELHGWENRLDEQASRCYQDLLELAENRDPAFGAELDDRGPDELTGLA